MQGAGRTAGAQRWLRRIGWLVVIWAASVACLAVAAWLLKGVMRLAGLSG